MAGPGAEMGARGPGFDPVAALIRLADMAETGFAFLIRVAHSAIRFRGFRFGFAGGLVWRGIAALTGVGLATALVTALSPGPSENSLATLTVQPAPEIRPVRDVRQEPRQIAAIGDEWTRIARPIAMFGLDSAELDRQQPVHEALRNQTGSRRQDVLTFGAFAEARPHLQLRLVSESGDAAPQQPFIIAAVREAAERGMSVQRSGVPTAIETRFGQVETADTTLSDGQSSRSCIAFRKSAGDLPLGLSGWWCGGASRPADRQQLVCLIDKISLLSAGEDKALRTAFSRTELARQPACAPPRLAASGRKASWLDADGAAPALRSKSAAVAEPAKTGAKR